MSGIWLSLSFSLTHTRAPAGLFVVRSRSPFLSHLAPRGKSSTWDSGGSLPIVNYRRLDPLYTPLYTRFWSTRSWLGSDPSLLRKWGDEKIMPIDLSPPSPISVNFCPPGAARALLAPVQGANDFPRGICKLL